MNTTLIVWANDGLNHPKLSNIGKDDLKVKMSICEAVNCK